MYPLAKLTGLKTRPHQAQRLDVAELRAETIRLADRDRWLYPLSNVCSAFAVALSAVAIVIVYFRA